MNKTINAVSPPPQLTPVANPITAFLSWFNNTQWLLTCSQWYYDPVLGCQPGSQATFHGSCQNAGERRDRDNHYGQNSKETVLVLFKIIIEDFNNYFNSDFKDQGLDLIFYFWRDLLLFFLTYFCPLQIYKSPIYKS